MDSLPWKRFRCSDPLRAPVRVLADVCVKELSAKEQRSGLSDSGLAKSHMGRAKTVPRGKENLLSEGFIT